MIPTSTSISGTIIIILHKFVLQDQALLDVTVLGSFYLYFVRGLKGQLLSLKWITVNFFLYSK